mgnify:FL=1
MMKLPHSLQSTIDFFERLPGIGPKSAKRLGFFLLRLPESDLKKVGEAIASLKSVNKFCQKCHNLTEATLCSICDDDKRDSSTVMVVGEVLDILSFESGTRYEGVYHVLHGHLDPLAYVGPEDLYIDSLIKRIENDSLIKEIIIATNPNTEGEATAMYLQKKLHDLSSTFVERQIKITRLAHGLPIGAQVEYADYLTLTRAMEGRREV